jgi:hypothetical protein
MSTLYKKIKLFKNNRTPVVYMDMKNRVITPTPRLNRIDTNTGLKISRNLTDAKTNEERAYVREVARYYVAIGKLKEVRKLVKSMSPGERRKLFESLTVPQIVDYFASIAGPFARMMGKKMNKNALVNVATNGYF